MSVNCQRCGTQVAANDWFCAHCGKERPRCPDCGAEMDETECKNCSTVRKAPCDECGLLIETTESACPHCEHGAVEAKIEQLKTKKEKHGSNFKKYLVATGVGVVLYYIISGIVPGPDVIGAGLGVLIAGPVVVVTGLYAVNAKRKQNKPIDAEGETAANIEKGRSENKSKAWREKKQREREAALNAAAEGLGAVSDAADSWSDSDSGNSTSSSVTEAVSSGIETFELEGGVADAAVQTDLNCPNCGQRWRVANRGLRQNPKLEGAQAMEKLEAIGDTKVQCGACNSTEYIDSWE